MTDWQKELQNVQKNCNAKRILVDVDGVICEYQFNKIVKHFFGVDISKWQIYAYDLADVLGVAPVMINNMFKEQVYGKPTFTEGAMETLNEWHKKHSIVIYSNRIKYMGGIGLVEWLTKYKIPFEGIDMNGTGTYDYFIDDSPAKLQSVDSKVKLLYSQPWNIHCFNLIGNLRRVHSWEEIRKEVV